MNARPCLIAAALFGLSGVILGAFGAHALQGYLPAGLLKAWHTAVLYQFVHGLALLGLGLMLDLQPANRWLGRSATCFALGILLFSGSLYLLALTQIGKLGMITPIGGGLFMLGWLSLLIAVWRWPPNPRPPHPSS